MMNSIKIALIQIKHSENAEKNINRAIEKIEDAAKNGAQIVSLSELFLSRYFCQTNDRKFFELAHPVPGRETERLAEIAKKHAIVIVASFFEKEANHFYNTACVIDADATFLGKYRKIHIPDDLKNYYSERFYFEPGNLGFPIFKTRYATIGVQVCWDQWFPEGARLLALKGAKIIFYPTAIGWQKDGNPELGRAEHNAWITVQRGHAISNTVFVAACNRVGLEDHLNFWGSSFVCDPLGRTLGQASDNTEETLLVRCDLQTIEKVRSDWPFLACRREEAYNTNHHK